MIVPVVRPARVSDREQLAKLRTTLWPESPIGEHDAELAFILTGKAPGVMPLVIFVSESGDGTLLGFIEVGLRSCADGCDIAHPVGYVEGWFVVEGERRKGVGTALLRAAEAWARTQGCVEIASDALIENHVSQRAHEALGFQEAARSVLYRKLLTPPSEDK